MRKNESTSSVSGKAKAAASRPAKPHAGSAAGKAAGKTSAPAKAPAAAANKKAAPAKAASAVKAPVRNAKAAPPATKPKTAPPAAKTAPAPARPAPVKPAPVKPTAPVKPAPVKPVVSPPEAADARPKARASASDISPKIIHMIAEEMAVEEAELTPSASFRDDLNLDEIDVAELLVRSEELFGLKQEFDDEEWENCQTVGDFIALVERRVSESSRRGASTSSSGSRKPGR